MSGSRTKDAEALLAAPCSFRWMDEAAGWIKSVPNLWVMVPGIER